jgi:steroid 5-alpha reductase family enzyme
VAGGPVLALMAPVCLALWAVSRRSRYFGNSAPLLVACFFLVLRVLSPHETGAVYGLIAVVFLLVFVGGIVTDLLETKARELGMAIVIGLLAANALWNLIGLARIT